MSKISTVSTAASTAASKPTLSAADLEVAGGLKATVLDIMKRVRMAPTPPAELPKFDGGKGLWRAKNGDALVAVTLSKPPAGMADGFTERALVNPKNNQFWVVRQGGIAGITSGMGPLGLPDGNKFTGKSYSQADIKALEKAANSPAKPKLFHFKANVLDAGWRYGMGIRPPGGGYAGPAITATVVFNYIDIKPNYKVKLDEKTKTFTVTIDGTTPNTVHPRVKTTPIELDIHVDRPATLGGTYQIKFVDPKGAKLFQTSFKNMLPA